jgi:hypothetical protein
MQSKKASKYKVQETIECNQCITMFYVPFVPQSTQTINVIPDMVFYVYNTFDAEGALVCNTTPGSSWKREGAM